MIIGLVVAWVIPSGEVEVAEVGRPAPDFTVPLLGGETFTLSSQLAADDRPIILNLWASWCIPCRTETPDISAFAVANPDVKVIGVAVEDTETAASAFAEEFAPSYDLGFADDEFEATYPRLGLPVTYIIGADGVIQEMFNGIVDQEILGDMVSG